MCTVVEEYHSGQQVGQLLKVGVVTGHELGLMGLERNGVVVVENGEGIDAKLHVALVVEV